MSDKNQKPSFIPKSPNGNYSYNRRSSFGAFDVIAITIFISALIAGTGIFLYKEVIEREVMALEEDLPAIEEVLGTELLNNLETASAQILAGERLLDSRHFSSRVFNLLQSYTAENIYFEDFQYQSGIVSQERVDSVSLKGRAPSYEALAFQVDTFKILSDISNVSVSGINFEEGGVVFNLDIKVNTRLLGSTNQLEE